MKSWKRLLALLSLLLLLLTGTVGTTLAVLMDSASSVTTVSVGSLGVALTASDAQPAVLRPGESYPCDPQVSVTAGSVDCWLFVKVECDDAFDWTQTAEWQKLPDSGSVYYCFVLASDGQPIHIVDGGKVAAKPDASGHSPVSLSFTAYAVQSLGFDDDPAAAWAVLAPAPGS